MTFPSWRYGPNGEADIFHDAADVPEGWTEHPGALAEVERQAEALEPVHEPQPVEEHEPPKKEGALVKMRKAMKL